PHRARGRRAPPSLRADHLDRPSRSHHARAHDPDRTPDLRTRRTHLPGHHAHYRRQRAHDRERKKGKTNTADPADQRDPQSLAPRARRRPRRSAVPEQDREAPQPRRDRAPTRPPPPTRRYLLPVDRPQAHPDAHP